MFFQEQPFPARLAGMNRAAKGQAVQGLRVHLQQLGGLLQVKDIQVVVFCLLVPRAENSSTR